IFPKILQRYCFMKDGLEGIRFYLLPDWNKVQEIGLWNIIVAAMNQAFFTLSLGIGAMMIFGSYLNKEHTLLGESVTIAALDTFVALVSGLIIFPACFSFGIRPDSGPSLIFLTLPNVFVNMSGGRIWGSLFFLFMSFASFSTIIAVFENIISCCMDSFEISRKKAVGVNIILIIFLSIPCIFGFNIWSGFHPLGGASNILDLEDFVVSNLLLPFGSLIFLIFCNSRFGWGFENYRKEANEGKGFKIPKSAKYYFAYVLPVLVFILMIQGLIGIFLKTG
ncbi:MAG: sodium-dependent transporter, partial [Acetivibrio sp.]